jgi:membrane associated rhomboid family serine protease
MSSGQKSEVGNQSWAGWICAAVVMALFGLQQIFPLREWLMLRGQRQGLPLLALNSATCHLVHGTLLHAAVNALTFVCLFYGVRRAAWMPPLLGGLVAGWMATFLFAVFLMPQYATLVGSSGMLFGMLGFFTAAEPFSRWRLCGIGSIPLIVLAPVLVAVDAFWAAYMPLVHIARPVHTVAFAFGAMIGTMKWPEHQSV